MGLAKPPWPKLPPGKPLSAFLRTLANSKNRHGGKLKYDTSTYRLQNSKSKSEFGVCLQTNHNNYTAKRPQTVRGEKVRRSEQPPLEIAGASLDRIHVCGTSTGYLRKIHASGSRRQDPGRRVRYKMHVAGPSARSMSPDPLKIHASGSMSGVPYLRPLYQMHIAGTTSQHPYPRALCKIHVSGYIARSVSQGHLEDPCLQILYIQDDVSGSMSQHLCLRAQTCGACTRSMSQDLLQDPCLRIHLRIYASAS